MPAVKCDVCGYASGLARLRVLWMPLVEKLTSQGAGEYVLCATCRGRVMDALAPVKAGR